LRDGAVVPVEQPRTRSKAYTRVAQMIKEAGPVESLDIAAANDEVAEQLAIATQGIIPGDVPRYKLGAALGTHTGPGTVAMIYTLAHS